MKIREIEITRGLRDGLYNRLIDFAIGRYPLFLFVKRNDVQPELNETGNRIIQSFHPFLRSIDRTKEWPGTRIMSDAEVFFYSLSNQSAQLLKQYSGSLYAWQHPSMPEDLCIMRNTTQPWLWTCAHEGVAGLYMATEEKAALLKELPDIVKYLGQEHKPVRYY